MAKNYNLKITSATVIAGNVVGAGKIARDVDDRLARRLLSAGKAELFDGPLPEAEEAEGEAEGNTGAAGAGEPAAALFDGPLPEAEEAEGEAEGNTGAAGAGEPAAAKKSGARAKAKKDDAE